MARAWKRVAVCKRVIVNTNAHAFSGILYRQTGPLLVLRDVTLLQPGTPGTPLDGEVIVERHAVEFIQVVS